MAQAAEIPNLLSQMKQVEEKVFEQEIEVKVIKAVSLADQGRNHECIRELDAIMQITEDRGSERQSKDHAARMMQSKSKAHDS